MPGHPKEAGHRRGGLAHFLYTSPLKLGATLTIPILQANPALFWPMSTRTAHQHHYLRQKSEQMNDLLKKVSDSLICSFLVSNQSDSLTVTHSL